MKLSRRDFLLSGASAAAMMAASSVEAGLRLHGSSGVAPTGFSQRSVVNMNFLSMDSYAFINHYTASATTPFATAYSATTGSFGQDIGADGWPNVAEANGAKAGGLVNLPAASSFTGPYVIQWQGDGNFWLDSAPMVWTETNLVIPSAATFVNGQPDITITTNTQLAVGTPIVFDTTAAGFTAWTPYYVLAAGKTNTNIRVTATRFSTTAKNATASGTLSNMYGPYQRSSDGRWKNTQGISGADARIIANISGTTAPTSLNVLMNGTDIYSLGSYAKNLEVFRLEDEADKLAGKIFRTGFKQPLVDLNPSAIRFMNWCDGGWPSVMRFENRRLPNTVGVNGAADFTQSPAYGDVSSVNQWALAAATPTSGNPKNTPVADFNGEIVTCRIKNANFSVRAGTRPVVTAITNANPGKVTTSGAHGFSTGDVIVHAIPGNMPRLHFFPVTITVTTSTEYTIGIDTTSFGTFNNAIANQFCAQYLSLSVGSRSAHPIMQTDGIQPMGYSGIAPGSNHSTFLFDRSHAGQTDGTAASFTGSISGTTLTVSSVTGVIAAGQTLGANTGGVAGGTRIVSGSGSTWTVSPSQTVSSRAMNSVGWVYGVWLYNEGGCANYVPIEYCTAMVNEINAMSIAQGIVGRVHCWLCTPLCALTATDPDYTTASDWGLGLVDVALNPSSSLRAGGYSILGNSAQLFIELSNELWNFNFIYAYSNRRQNLRWPGTSGGVNTDWHAFQSSLMMKTIKAAYPSYPIKTVLGGFAVVGAAPGAFGANYELMMGSNTLNGTIDQTPGYSYTTDPYVIANSFGVPMNNHDAFAIAPYNDPPDAYYSTSTGTGTFTDDSAMYNGINNTGNGGGNYSGAANPTQAITNYVNQMLGTPPLAGAQATTFYVDAVGNGTLKQFADVAAISGKVAINYEGGTDWAVDAGVGQAGHTLTSGDAIFAKAIINSSQWATAQVGYFNRAALVPNAAMQAVYNHIGYGTQRWSYAYPDSYAGTTEGLALTNNLTWAAMGTRNRALSL